MKETQFTSAIISITKKLVNGQFNITEPEKDTLISLLLPPCVTVENLKKLEQLGKTLKAEFVKNPCYNSGRLTTMALPLIVTGGVYALEKIPALLVSVTSKGIKVTKKIQALLKSSFKLKPKTSGSGYVLNDGDVVLANYDDLGGFVDDVDNLPVQAISLSEYITLQLNKNIRNAILNLAESKIVARKYFDKIKSNPNNYITDYTSHLDDFDSWYENVFKSDLFEAHHLLPKNILRDNAYLQEILNWARQNGKTWDFGSIDNGIMLQKRSKNSLGEIVGDHANHPKYDEKIRLEIKDIFTGSNGNMSKAFDDLEGFVNDLKIKLNLDVIEGDFIVNTVNMP